jgi:hypothetical protein
MRRHLKAHSGVKPFRCVESVCDRRFSRKSHLQEHCRLKGHRMPEEFEPGRNQKRSRPSQPLSHAKLMPLDPLEQLMQREMTPIEKQTTQELLRAMTMQHNAVGEDGRTNSAQFLQAMMLSPAMMAHHSAGGMANGLGLPSLPGLPGLPMMTMPNLSAMQGLPGMSIPTLQMPSLPGFMGFPGLPSAMQSGFPGLSGLPGFPGLGGLPGFPPEGLNGMTPVNPNGITPANPGPLDAATASFFANLLPSMPPMGGAQLMPSSSSSDAFLTPSTDLFSGPSVQMSSDQGPSPMVAQGSVKRAVPEMTDMDPRKRARPSEPSPQGEPPSAAALAAVAAASAAAAFSDWSPGALPMNPRGAGGLSKKPTSSMDLSALVMPMSAPVIE